MVNRIILIALLSIIVLSGCSLMDNQISFDENQLKINAYLLDNTNMEKLNECTKLNACDGWKCLCDKMVSENDYCQRYEDFCVNDICAEITNSFNGVNFMNDYSGDRNFLCSGVYDKVIVVIGIDLDNISNEMLTCLSDYRNNQDVPDDYFYHYQYRDERFLDSYGEVICERRSWEDCLEPCDETKDCTEFMECSKICDLQFGFAPDRTCATFWEMYDFNDGLE